MNDKNDNIPADSPLRGGPSPSGAGGTPPPPPPHSDSHLPADDLDALLRQWHTVNAARAAAGRDRLLASLASESPSHGLTVSPSQAPSAQSQPKPTPSGLPPLLSLEPEADPIVRAERRALRHQSHTSTHTSVVVLRRIFMNRYVPAAALVALALLLPFLLPPSKYLPGPTAARADDTILCPDGGRLDALDDERNVLGPCALKHTDVVADVSGFLTRVTLKQKYHNPYQSKIEAVYTFPLSNHAAVDRMNMTIGNRVIIGQVKERAEARQIYEQAKANNQVASLLEQERPNIFTQSIANIEPGADIDIEISYVEITQQENGEFSFEFPTTVGPRYIPGTPTGTIALPAPVPGQPPCPDYIKPRRGIVLLAPATISNLEPGDTSRGVISAYALAESLKRAQPIRAISPMAPVWYNFRAAYGDGSAEMGTLYTDGTGTLNSRWFYCAPGQFLPAPAPEIEPVPPAVRTNRDGGDGGGFAPDTNQVPDASKITPMPTRPPTRAGHDISITVNIDTGGPALLDVKSPLHEIVKRPGAAQGDDSPATARTTITLANLRDIPNRDFVLKWKQSAAQVEPSVFAHTAHAGQGNFFSVTLLPPERVDDTMALPRELIFVLDTSGSMNGFPIEKAKTVIARAIDTMRSFDTFNLITFAGDTRILWNRPRPATQANREEAQQFLASRTGSGGTEMMKAINAALEQRDWARPVERLPRPLSPDDLANLPADGREIRLVVPSSRFIKDDAEADTLSTSATYRVRTSFGTEIVVRARGKMWAIVSDSLTITGRWNTDQGTRFLDLTSIDAGSGDVAPAGVAPLRIVMFLTDGFVGNDMAIIDAIQHNRGTTRVFSFGVGNSVNHYLLDGMARAGGGEVEYVTLNDSSNAAVEHFTTRVQTPVLTNISVQFSPNIQAENVLTALGAGGGGGGVSDLTNIPDLFDVKPLTIVGRYASPAHGQVTISGTTAAGPWTKTIDLNLPAQEPAHDTVATLWARTKVESIMNANLSGAQRDVLAAPARSEIVSLGEKFGLLTQYTSFVAVDRLRITYGGKPRLVHIPIELPQGNNFDTTVGGPGGEWRYLNGDRGVDQLGLYDFSSEGVSTLALDARYVEVPEIDLQGLLQQSQQSRGGGGAGPQFPEIARVYAQQPPSGGRASGEATYGLPSITAAPPPPPAPPPPGADEADRLARELSERARTDVRYRLSPSSGSRPLDSGRQNAPQEAAGEPAPRNPDAARRTATPRGVEDLTKRMEKTAADGSRNEAAPPAKPAEAEPQNKPQDAAGPSAPARTADGKAKDGDSLRRADTERAQEKKEALTRPGAATAPSTPAAEDHRKLDGARKPAPTAEPKAPAELKDQSPPPPPGAVLAGDDTRDQFAQRAAVEGRVRAISATEELRQLDVPQDFYKKVLLKNTDGPRTSHDDKNGVSETAPTPARFLLPQQVIRYAVWLVNEGKPEDARHVADLLADAKPDYQPGVELRNTLADDQLAKSDRDTILARLDEGAAKSLDDLTRRIKLFRRLDASLRPLAMPSDPAAPLTAPQGATTTEGGILLTILLSDTAKPTIAALEKAGLKIEDTDTKLNIIIGAAPLTSLADIALVDAVRKVEPTHE